MIDPGFTLKEGSKVTSDSNKRLQYMIFFRLVQDPNHLGPIIGEF